MKIPDIVSKIVYGDCAIIADSYSTSIIPKGLHVREITSNTEVECISMRNDNIIAGASTIIGIGGCAALDIAKSISCNKDKLVVIPTILSTNCISSGRSVINSGLRGISLKTRRPDVVIISINGIMDTTYTNLKKWSQSGFGDYFASVSAAIDRNCLNKNSNTKSIISDAQSVFKNLHFIIDNFTQYDHKIIEFLAKTIHSSSDNESGSAALTGGEHFFYRALLELNPDLRFGPATHGQIVALGTLLTARAFGSLTSDFYIYNLLLAGFSKLDIPTKYESLYKIGIYRNMIYEGLKLISDDSSFGFFPSLLGTISNKNIIKFIDETLS